MKRILLNLVIPAFVGITSTAFANVSSLDKVVFKRDMRPVDGILNEISLEKASDGSYTATQLKVFPRMGLNSSQSQILESGLQCNFAMHYVSCSVNLLPVDGAFTNIYFTKIDNHPTDPSLAIYDAKMNQSFFDHTTGQLKTTQTNLGERLELQAQANLKVYSFSKNLMPADGALTVVELKENNVGNFNATLSETYIPMMGSGVVGDVKDIAVDLPCDFSFDSAGDLEQVICSRDDRPVDGELYELIIKKDLIGRFDVMVHINFYDRLNGKEVDETEVLATGLKPTAPMLTTGLGL